MIFINLVLRNKIIINKNKNNFNLRVLFILHNTNIIKIYYESKNELSINYFLLTLNYI